jgi:cytochrome c
MGPGRTQAPKKLNDGAEMMMHQRSFRTLIVSFAAVILLFFALVVFPRVSQADDAADRGRQLFEKRCTGCHSLDQNKEGPHLRGVYGRQAGKISGFSYSAALQSSQLIWDDALLDKWLTNTDSLVADNDMAFRVSKPDERADIIRYLKTLSVK